MISGARVRNLFLLPLLLSGAAYSQAAHTMQFEVVSVKPGGDVFSTRPQITVGRLRWTTQVAYLIGYAYHLDFTRVDGPHLGDVYSIEATFEPAATNEDLRLMIQALLTDRFKMRSHRTSVTTEGYALLPGKGKNKLEPSKSDTAESYVSAITKEAGVVQLTGRNSSITELAVTLQRVQKTPIWDRTGVAGNYDFTFRYALDSSADVRAEAPSLSAALQQTLGLSLKKEKGPLETLVIDSIEQPSDN